MERRVGRVAVEESRPVISLEKLDSPLFYENTEPSNVKGREGPW